MTIRVKTLFLAAVLAVSATAAYAAVSQGGSTGANFSCDVNTGDCSCTGAWEGADCQAMKKNCKEPKNYNCNSTPPLGCSCSMFPSRTDSKKPTIERAPGASERK